MACKVTVQNFEEIPGAFTIKVASSADNPYGLRRKMTEQEWEQHWRFSAMMAKMSDAEKDDFFLGVS